MPKNHEHEFALHSWTSSLSFQMQALLFTGMRGPDASPKHNAAKIIVRYLRGTVIKPAGNWDGSNNNDFMWGEFTTARSTQPSFENYAKDFWDNHDEYPHHFIMHLFHCAEVIAYMHPDSVLARNWLYFYNLGCESFHLNPETKEQLLFRLNDFNNPNIQRQNEKHRTAEQS